MTFFTTVHIFNIELEMIASNENCCFVFFHNYIKLLLTEKGRSPFFNATIERKKINQT